MEGQEQVKRLGIMGGTFDPIHYGHLVTAEEVRGKFGLDQVVFVPCGQPVHKKTYQVTPAEHRYVMVALATVSNPYFHASRVEIDRETPSYAIETIEHFRRQFGPGCEVYFITGADAILEILTWHRNEELVRLCRFVAATRPGYDLAALRERVGEQYLDRIDFVLVPGIDTSSTEIRARIAAGLPIRYLTPLETEMYIRKHRLYQGSAFEEQRGEGEKT